jgi:uncharacterized protein YdgA (DUF945 family)
LNKSVTTAVVVGAAVVVVGAFLGATEYTGRQVEARFQQEASELKLRYPFLRVSTQTYSRGFFRSTSTIELQLGCPSPDAAKALPTVKLTSVIHNGPLAGYSLGAASVDSVLSLSGEAGQKLSAAFGSAAPLSVHTVIGFNRSYSSDIVIPTAKWSKTDEGEFVWQGLTGTIESHGEPRTVSYRIKSPGLTLSDDHRGANFKMGAFEINAHGKAVSAIGSLMVGDSQLSVDSMEMNLKPEAGAADKATTLLFTGIKVTGDSSLDGELMSSKATVEAAGVVNGTKIDRIDAKMSTKRLHAPTVERMMNEASSSPTGCDPSSKPVAAIEILSKMQADVMSLLQYDPEFALDKLAVDYNGQHGEMAYSVGAKGITAADSKAPPMALIEHLQVKASMHVPTLWIDALGRAGSARTRQVPDPAVMSLMMDKGIAQGFLVRDGEFLASTIEFDHGRLLVNGKPMLGNERGRCVVFDLSRIGLARTSRLRVVWPAAGICRSRPARLLAIGR